MFNNNTYTDYRTANKRILIPSYVCSRDFTEPKGHKTKLYICNKEHK